MTEQDAANAFNIVSKSGKETVLEIDKHTTGGIFTVTQDDGFRIAYKPLSTMIVNDGSFRITWTPQGTVTETTDGRVFLKLPSWEKSRKQFRQTP